MVSVSDFVAFGIPEIFVAGFHVRSIHFIVVVDGEVECHLAVAAIAVDVRMRVHRTMVKGYVHVISVVLPAVGVAAGLSLFNAVAGSELKVEHQGAVA